MRIDMDIRTLIDNHMHENGYDGLYNPDVNCACKKSDLIPCGGDPSDCRFGYIQTDDSDEFIIGETAIKKRLKNERKYEYFGGCDT